MPYPDPSEGPLISSHRGANREFPENTLEAFRRGIKLGADVLELDIHATQDGVFVVSHDETGARMAGRPQSIAQSTWSEIRTWDAGWGFAAGNGVHPFRDQGIRFPRLEEVLVTFPSTPLNVDVKGAHPAQLAPLVASIHAVQAEERVLLTSFSAGTIATLRRLKYAGPLGLSRRDVTRLLLAPERLNRMLGFAGVRAQIPPNSGPFNLSCSTFIEKCHRLGLAVDYWVINDSETASDLLRRGADGIVTDDVATIATLYRQSLRTSAWRARHRATVP